MKKFKLSAMLLFAAMIMFSACGGGGGGGSDDPGDSDSKAFIYFVFKDPNISGFINDNDKTITVDVPADTNIKSLVAIFTTSGKKVFVNDIEQISGKTSNNFSNQVVYTIEAENGTKQDYLITVIGDLKVKPSNVTLYTGCEYEFNARSSINLLNIQNVIWEVNDTSIAKIDSNGILIPLKAGTVRVNATSKTGVKAESECAISTDSITTDFTLSSGTISKYIGSKTNIAIPHKISGVEITAIGDKAFFDCQTLESIEIPTGVTTIGASSFFRCIKLKSIVIPPSVTTIMSSAFNICKDIECIKLSSGLTTIQDNAFGDCEKLIEIDIPPTVTTIGQAAFMKCVNLESIEIPSSISSIPYNLFDSCIKLKNVKLNTGLTYIGICAFNNCYSIESISIPSTIKIIDENVFNSCTSFKNLKISAEVPPTAHNFLSFLTCPALLRIEVPNSSLSTYQNTIDWKDYKSIIVGF